MPYYSELGIYTPSSSYTSPLLKGPYSSHSSILASNILPPSSKQFSRSNFRGFKPHLMTISESSNASLPVRRINSPKVLYHSSPKVRVPRPVKINTADIDVSLNRYNKYSPQSKPLRSTAPESKSPSPHKEVKPNTEAKEAKPNTTIRRDRATIRLQTIHKDALEKEIGEIKSWRDNFKPEELVTEAKRQKKTPGEILKEKFLIRSRSKDNVPQLETPQLTRKLSVKKSTSFKNICKEITSDNLLEDLNPGQPVEIRRRQSRQLSQDDLIKELHRSSSTLSVEEVQILDALLQAENEVGLYNVPPDIEKLSKSVKKKKAAKKKSSEKLNLEDKKTDKQENGLTKEQTVNLDDKEVNRPPIQRRSILKTQVRKSSSELSIPDTSVTSHTRLRKDSSLKNMVKDISQVEIEMIPVKQKQKHIITGSVGDIEEKAKSSLKAVVEDLAIQESPKLEKKEKKFRFNVTVEEFPVKQIISAPKFELKKDNYGVAKLPLPQVPVTVGILKKIEQKHFGNISGDDKVLKKKVVQPKKLIKSLSEVQVRNKDRNKIQKSESNDGMTETFTVTVNRTQSDNSILTNGDITREGSAKLKIVSIEKSFNTASKLQAVENDKDTLVNDKCSNVSKNIPDIKSKEEASKTNDLFKTTKKDLKSDTFLQKSSKENAVPWTDRLKKTQTKSLEDTTLIIKNKDVSQKSVSVDESDRNNDINEEVAPKTIGFYKRNESDDNLKKTETKSLEETPQIIKNKDMSKKSVLVDKSDKNDDVNKEVAPKTVALNKRDGSADRLKKTQTKSLEEAPLLTEKKDVPKKSISMDESDTKNHITKEVAPKIGAFKKRDVSADRLKTQPKSPKETPLIVEQKNVPKDSVSVDIGHKNNGIKEEVAVKTVGLNKTEDDLANKNTNITSLDNKLKVSEKKVKDNKIIEPVEPVEAKKAAKDENDNQLDFWGSKEEKYEPPKLNKLKLEIKDPKAILNEIQKSHKEVEPETPEEKEKRMMSKRSLIQKANKDDPDLVIFEPPTPPTPQPVKEPSPEPSFVPLQSNRLSQWMHPWKKPDQVEENLQIFAKPKFIRARHIPRRWLQNNLEDCNSEDSTTSEEDSSSEDSDEESDEESDGGQRISAGSKVGASTSSNDSGFDSGRANNLECDVNCHKKCQKLMANLCGINQKLVVEAIEKVRKGSIDSRDSPGNTLTPACNPAFALDFNDLPEEVSLSSTYQSFQRSGRITPPATTIPRFRKYCVDDFNFLKVLGKGSFGKVLLAELKGTEYYYAIKCLKKDVVLEDDDVECTLIERKVLALGTKHPYLCHLLCTFQTESHLFFVMEYLNGGDLMFHIQVERRFSEARAKFYGAEIVSGLKFLHNKGIVYRDLKLDNILLDFDGHVRIADFGMCKLQIFLDRMADTFCGTPDYMAPEIIKGQHYNQCVDWWSFGVLLYEMLLGQSPFSGCDEDELFWSICNEKPVIPRFLSAEASSVLTQFLEKDANKRLGNRFSPHGDIQDHPFFQPIDWAKLENRQLEPPFKPNLQHPLDTQYFDKTFTTEKAKLTPIEGAILQSMDQTQFQGFSYTNPNATDK